MDKKKQNLIIFGTICGVVVIVVLIIVIAMLAAKAGNDSNNSSSENVSSSVDWSSYLLTQNISKVTLTRKRSKEYNDPDNMEKTVNITIDELKNIIEEIKTLELEETYALSLGKIDKDHLTVTYLVDSKEYMFEVYHGAIFVNKSDDKLIEIFENGDYPIFNKEIRNTAGVYKFYQLIDFSADMYDKYFN